MAYPVVPRRSHTAAALRAALFAALLAAGAPRAAGAQQGPQQSVMRGRVVTADSTHRPIENAEVTIPALGRAARTAADGTYELTGLRGGAHVVDVRRLGFVPVRRGVIMSGEADDTAAVTFALAPSVAALATVLVRDDAGGGAREMERERARSNGGVFVDRATLERNEHSVMTNVLRRVPGVSIVRVPSRQGVINVLGSARGSTRIMGQGRPRSPYCFYQIYVDGVLRYAPSDDGGAEPPPDVDQLKVSEYEAIEIYRGGAQVPPQYGGTGAACGTALLWTRTR
jgi:hypothetical protein